MKLIIPLLGKTRASYLEAGVQEYASRLRRYASLELPLLREQHVHGAPEESTKIRQAAALLEAARAAAVVVALDPEGEQLDSLTLSAQLARWEQQGGIAFLVGGHLGLHASLLRQSSHILSLSRCTFTHEMTRLLLLEQLYRACAIHKGHKYHH